MQSFWLPCQLILPDRIHPALTSFADECCGMLARLIAYVGTLALLAIVGVHLWDQLPDIADAEPPREGRLERGRAHAAGIRYRSDQIHPIKQWVMKSSGIPKVAARTSSAGRRRPPDGRYADCGTRNLPPGRGIDHIAARHGRTIAPDGPRCPTRARSGGGHRQQIRQPGPAAPRRQQGWGGRLPRIPQAVRRAQSANLRLDLPGRGPSGPACRDRLRAGRLVLLTAGNDPKLAELFARAELRRANCSPAASPAISADWVVGAENPLLRGRL